jgi:hypothetical protein
LAPASGITELFFAEYWPDAGKFAGRPGFTDNEVTLVIDGRSHILSLTAQRLPEGLSCWKWRRWIISVA